MSIIYSYIIATYNIPIANKARIAMNATAPITPPAIAPVFAVGLSVSVYHDIIIIIILYTC